MSWGMSSRTTPRETSLASLDAMVSAVMGSELQRCRSCGGVKTYGCTRLEICSALQIGSCRPVGGLGFRVIPLGLGRTLEPRGCWSSQDGGDIISRPSRRRK
jgi:hypothetical protein